MTSRGHDRQPLPYLSERWLTAADAAVRALAPLPVVLRIGYEVIGGPPDGRTVRAHTLVLGPGRVGFVPGLDEPSVTLTTPWPLAVAIARGEVSAQRAFLDGHVELAGRPDALLGHQEELATIDDLLADVRADTIY